MSPDAQRLFSAVAFVAGVCLLVACAAVVPADQRAEASSIYLAPVALIVCGAVGGARSKS